MIRHAANNFWHLLLCAAITACLLLPLNAVAENAAEAPPPKADPAKEKGEQSPNTAEGSVKKTEPEKPAEQPPINPDKEKGDPKKTGSESVPDNKTVEDKPVGPTVVEGDKPSESPENSELEKLADQGPATVVEPDATKDDSSAEEGSGLIGEAEATVVEGAVDTTPIGPQAPGTETPQVVEGATGEATPNTAESRAAGTATPNMVEGGDSGSVIAEPPLPTFSLPSPAELAGATDEYVAPGIELVVPGLESTPERVSQDAFVSPQRSYLDTRPLPPIDEDETDEERISRNIEESLRLIDLGAEQRPEGGITIPLPSGVVTFKASDSFSFDRKNRILTFNGNAEIIFEDIAIWADLIEVHDGAAMAYASGYVAIQNNDEIVYCDEAYLNYDTRILELFYVEGNTGGPRLQGTLYFTADRAHGTFDNLIMEHVEATTCEPFCGDVDEFHLSARKAVFKRNKSITLHDVHPYMRSHKIGWVPLLAFPLQQEPGLEQEESEIQQTYGYNRSEGWFGKFAYTYSARYAENVSGSLKGVVKLDMTEKKGPGFGIRQDFLVPGMGVGTVRAFYQEEWPWELATFSDGTKAEPQKNFNFEYTQELNFSQYLKGNMSVNRDNTFVPSNTLAGTDRRTNTWRNRFNLNYRKAKTSIALTANQSINIQGGITQSDGTQEPLRETTTNSLSLQADRELTKDFKLSISQQYNSSKGAAGRENLPADQEGTFETRLNWTGRRDTEMEGYTGKLSYLERGIDYDGDANTTDRQIQVREELPSLEVSLPRDLINDGAYFNSFRVNLDNLVTGRRSSPESSLRGKLQVGGQDRVEFSNASNMNTSVNMEQFWYDDGNAQYVISPRINYSYDTKDWIRFDTSWNMVYPQGVREPPVQGDRRIYSQSSSYGFTFTDSRSWNWRIRGGYNIRDTRHNPVTSTFNWDANRTFGITQTTGFNIETKKFNPSHLIGYVRSPYVDPEGFYNWVLKFTIDNDIENNFKTTRLDLKWLKRYERGWSSEITGSYRTGTNAPPDFSEEFAKEFIKKVVIRKVNCCTTIEGGWRTGINEMYINIFLNALPQYPGTADLRRPFDNEFSGDYLFPTEQLQRDILLDMFGINQRLF